MKTKIQFNQDILVWSIILALFGVLTIIAVNMDRIRSVNERNGQERRIQSDIIKYQTDIQVAYGVSLTQ